MQSGDGNHWGKWGIPFLISPKAWQGFSTKSIPEKGAKLGTPSPGIFLSVLSPRALALELFFPFYFVFSDENSCPGPVLHSLCHTPWAWDWVLWSHHPWICKAQGLGRVTLAGAELAVPLQPSLQRGGHSWDTEPRARHHQHQTSIIN